MKQVSRTYQEILAELVQNSQNWDGTLTMGELVLGENQRLIDQMQQSSPNLATTEKAEALSLLQVVYSQTQAIQAVILREKVSLSTQMGQLNQQAEKVKNYFYAAQQSRYIDRDF